MSGEDIGSQAVNVIYQAGKYVYDHPEIIAGVAAGIGLIFTAMTFRRQQIHAQVRMMESVFNDIRDMERELSNLPESTIPDKLHRDWDSRFFNTLEWLAFLINERQVRHSKLVGFFKDAIVAWYEKVFLVYALDSEKTDETQYPELKKLYRKLKTKKRFNFWWRRGMNSPPNQGDGESLKNSPNQQAQLAEPDTIGKRDLLQFNAVIIAGALILLTITSASGYKFADQAFKTVAAFSLVPFLISSIILIFSPIGKLLFPAKIATAIGFLYVGLALGLIVAFA